MISSRKTPGIGDATGKPAVIDKAETTVVYLARFAEGREPVETFARSYRRHPSGLPHDLIVVWKGFPASGGDDLREPLRGIANQSVDIPDEGFDLTAYAAAARQSTHAPRMVFLNTFSEIVADSWLRKLDAAFADPSHCGLPAQRAPTKACTRA